MSKKRKNGSAASKLQAQFDRFVKKTIQNVILNVLAKYVENLDHIKLVSIEDYEDLAAPEVTPDYEKEKVVLDQSFLLLENEILAAGIRKLKKKYRQILECAYVLDMPNEAIAELMNLEYQTVCNYRHEAYVILKKYMEESDNE